jgi:hypothetical protein
VAKKKEKNLVMSLKGLGAKMNLIVFKITSQVLY